MDLFDLRDSEWIPVQEKNGTIHNLGMEEVMRRAHELRQVQGASPLETVSLYRFLVGLAHHLVGDQSAEEWVAIGASGRFDEADLERYFRKSPWKHRFRLFDGSFPFWQLPGLSNIDPKAKHDRPVLASTLLHQLASGNNKTLFSHLLDSDAFSFTPAESARSLVTAQYFSLSGLNNKTSNLFGYQQSYLHAPFVAGMPSIIMGDTLFKTIVLNMLPKDHRGAALEELPLGLPPWGESREAVVDVKRTATKEMPTIPQSYLEYLLPRSRHVRLLPEEGGDGTITVRRLHIAQGVAWDASWEPWFLMVEDKKKNSIYPSSFKPDRAVWRNSAAYLGWSSKDSQGKKTSYLPPKNLKAYGGFRGNSPKGKKPSRVARLAVFALANHQEKSLAWRHETLDFAERAMEDTSVEKEIGASLETIERVAGILRSGVERFYREAFRNNDRGQKAVPPQKANSSPALRTYWGRVEEPFRAVLLEESTSEACMKRCIKEAGDIFEQTMNAVVGVNINLFPARAKAEGQFMGSLKKLKKEFQLNDYKEVEL